MSSPNTAPNQENKAPMGADALGRVALGAADATGFRLEQGPNATSPEAHAEQASGDSVTQAIQRVTSTL